MIKITFVVIAVLGFIASVSDGAGKYKEQRDLVNEMEQDDAKKTLKNLQKVYDAVVKDDPTATSPDAGPLFHEKSAQEMEAVVVAASELSDFNAVLDKIKPKLTALEQKAAAASTQTPQNTGTGGGDANDPSSVPQSAPSMMIAAFVVIAFLMN